MVAVQLSGGLGNQMFEYALYLKLRSMGRDVRIDDFTCYGAGERSLQLGVFGIKCDSDDGKDMTRPSPDLHYSRLTRQEYVALTDCDRHLCHRVRRRLTGRKDLSYREYSTNFDPQVLEREPALLLGCFQTERYFSDIEAQVREAYRFRALSLSEEMRAYEEQIAGSRAVSVHVRRGDYLDPRYSALYAGICDEDYYDRAMARMKQLVPDARFFFFSNDAAWVKKHYAGTDFVTVEGNDEENGSVDLYLMSRCQHHIIANSSFSWWGAWLNPDPCKRVIAPARWLNRVDSREAYAREECRDIYTKNMIRI